MTGQGYWMKLLRWWHRPPAPARADDFGDFGTAFGLDLSLEHQRRTLTGSPHAATPLHPEPAIGQPRPD
jgi:hypothetical protein